MNAPIRTFVLTSLVFGCAIKAISQPDKWHAYKAVDVPKFKYATVKGIINDTHERLYVIEQYPKTLSVYCINLADGSVSRKLANVKTPIDFSFEVFDSRIDEAEKKMYLKQVNGRFASVDLAKGKLTEGVLPNLKPKTLYQEPFWLGRDKTKALPNGMFYTQANGNKVAYVSYAWGYDVEPLVGILSEKNSSASGDIDELYLKFILSTDSSATWNLGTRLINSYETKNPEDARSVIEMMLNKASFHNQPAIFSKTLQQYKHLLTYDAFKKLAEHYRVQKKPNEYVDVLFTWRESDKERVGAGKKAYIIDIEQQRLIEPIIQLMQYFVSVNELKLADSAARLALEDEKWLSKRTTFYWRWAIFYNAAKVDEKLYRYNEAEEKYLKVYNDKYDTWKEGVCMDLFSLYIKTGNKSGQEKMLKKLFELSKDKFGIRLRTANIYRDQGRFHAAEEIYTKLLDEKNLEDGQRANSLLEYAYHCQLLNNETKSKVLFSEGSQLWMKIDNGKRSNYLETLPWIFNNQIYFGRHAEAKQTAQEELQVASVIYGDTSLRYKDAVFRQAQQFFNNGMLAEADALCNKLMQQKYRTESYSDMAASFDLLRISLLRKQTKKKEALDLTQASLNKALTGNVVSQQLITAFVSVAAGIEEELQLIDGAEKSYQKLITFEQQKSGNQSTFGVLDATHRLALFYWRTGKQQQADVLIPNVLRGYKKLAQENLPYLTAKEKSDLYNALNFRIQLINTYALTRYEDPDVAAMLTDATLFDKSLFLTMNKNFRSLIRQQRDTTLRAQMKTWLNLKMQLQNVQILPEHERIKLGLNITKLTSQSETLEKDLIKKIPDMAKIFRTDFSWKEIAGSLHANEAGVEIIQIPEIAFNGEEIILNARHQYVAICVLPDKSIRIVQLGDNASIEKMAKYYRNTTNGKVLDSLTYANLWQPVQNILQERKIERVYLSVDGLYSVINIGALYTGKGKIVSDVLEVINVNSLRDLQSVQVMEQINLQQSKLLVFANPWFSKPVNTASVDTELTSDEIVNVPDQVSRSLEVQITELAGTKSEAEAIKKMAAQKGILVTAFDYQESTEQNFKKSNSEILHVATHGYFLNDSLFFGRETGKEFRNNKLLQSGLLLAGAQSSLQSNNTNLENDGILTAADVAAMNLGDTYLTVLSACETGLGNLIPGEGPYGLRRAFQLAGSRNVIISLWKVNDEITYRLMTLFYENLFKGITINQALIQAQTEIRKTHPELYYWGAFILIQS